MSDFPEFEEAVNKLNAAILVGNKEEIEAAKINLLYTSYSYFEIILNYLTLEKAGIHFNFGSFRIKKGTALYRVRNLNKTFDINDPKEWGPSPFRKENRANREGEEAIYLNVDPHFCVLETHIKENEKYALAKYEVLEDIEVGGFFDISDKKLLSAGILLNAFLIAPCRGDSNREVFEFLDERFGKLTPDDIVRDDIISKNHLLPFKLAVINQRDNTYYNVTNNICDTLKKNYPDGIKYSSCFVPVETIRIESNCYNVVLYEQGVKKIKFVEAKVCKNISNNKKYLFTGLNVIKLLCDGEKNE